MRYRLLKSFVSGVETFSVCLHVVAQGASFYKMTTLATALDKNLKCLPNGQFSEFGHKPSMFGAQFDGVECARAVRFRLKLRHLGGIKA